MTWNQYQIINRNNLIQGVEYNHPKNSEEMKKQIKDISQKHDLIMTCRTDFHGNYSNSPHPIGSFTCPEGEVEILIRLEPKIK